MNTIDFLPVQQMTADGVYMAGNAPISNFSISVDGDFNGAVVEFGYISDVSGFVPFGYVTKFYDNNQIIVRVGLNIKLAWRVSGAKGSTLLTCSIFEILPRIEPYQILLSNLGIRGTDALPT